MPDFPRWRLGPAVALLLGVMGCGLTEADLFIPQPAISDDDPDSPAPRDAGRRDGSRPSPPPPDDSDGGPGPDNFSGVDLDLDNDASIAIGRPSRRPCARGAYAGELRCRFEGISIPLTAHIAVQIGAPDESGGPVEVSGDLIGLSTNPDRPLFEASITGEYDCEAGALTAKTDALGGALLPVLSWTRGAKLEGEHGTDGDALMGLIDAPGAPGGIGCKGSWTAETVDD